MFVLRIKRKNILSALHQAIYRDSKKNHAEDYSSSEKEFVKSSLGLIGRIACSASESLAESRAAVLQKYGNYQKN